MAEMKTKKNDASVEAFLAGLSDPSRRADCETVIAIMKSVTGKEPKMWGNSIVGFGEYHYKYESGREGDMCLAGFSPRKQNLTVYLTGMKDYGELLKKLGKHKTGGGCLYIKEIADVNRSILMELIKASVNKLKKKA